MMVVLQAGNWTTRGDESNGNGRLDREEEKEMNELQII